MLKRQFDRKIAMIRDMQRKQREKKSCNHLADLLAMVERSMGCLIMSK